MEYLVLVSVVNSIKIEKATLKQMIETNSEIELYLGI